MENKDCNFVMTSEDTKILEFNQYQKSDKASFIIYADLKCLIEKIVSEHIPSGFSMSTKLQFKRMGNKHFVFRGRDCMKNFCESLREHAMEKINFKK